MNLNIPKIAFPAALFVAGAVAGLGLGWKLYHPKAPKLETYAPEVRQKDGSLILERKPQTFQEAKAAIPHAPMIPKGAVVERLAKVVVQPSPLPAIPTPGSGVSSVVPAKPDCPPVEVDFALVKLKDGSQRVIASSPSGEVIQGLDIPVVLDKPVPKPLRWAAGGLWNPGDRTYGAYLRRAMGPFEVGIQVQQERLPIQIGGGTRIQGFISAGIRW